MQVRGSGGIARRRWRLTLAVLLLVVSASVVVRVLSVRRHAVLDARAAEAVGAVAEARNAGGATWAPDELRAAETALGAAMAAHRGEQVRWWPIPDVGRVSAAFAEVEAAARRSGDMARARRGEAERAADRAIDEAEAAVLTSAELADSIHVGADRRTLLARARTALEEARVYRRELDFGTAARRAQESTALAGQVRDHAAVVAARYADADTLARWRRWKQETIDWSRREGRPAIIVSKEAHTLTLFVRGRVVRTFRADMGFNWIADKRSGGDGATPEGRYRVVARKANGASAYYKALLLDYPNADDRARYARARRSGELPLSATIGSLIEIHGEGGRGRDWTRGCVAVTNADMDELFMQVPVGTPVTIVGSDDYGTIADFANGHRDAGAGR